MNELTVPRQNVLLQRIRSDLTAGYMVLGNYNVKNDILRVWCRNHNTGSIFLLVATSGKRFGNDHSFLELQHVNSPIGGKLSLLLIDGRLHNSGLDKYWPPYLNDYLSSEPDVELTESKMDKENHNEKDLVYPVTNLSI